MADKYSIAEARHNLAALVHDLEKKERIELTRRGEPVAVLLSIRAYRRLSARKATFWDAYTAYLQSHDLAALDITPEVFEGVRDQTPGREIDWS